MQIYTADNIVSNGQMLQKQGLLVEDGRILKLAPLQALKDQHTNVAVVQFADAMIIPGLVNSHNHSFQSLLKGFCDDCDFFTWRDQALYKYSKLLSRDDIYTGALFAFGEMLKCGITTVCDFFYINDQANENASAVIEAALHLGIRIVMARTLYDWDGAPSRFRETIHQAIHNTE